MEDLKTFLETSPLSVRAAESIKDGREVELIVSGEAFTFTKKSKKNVLVKEKPQSPDITFELSVKTAQELSSKGFDNVGQVGLFIFEKMLSNNAEDKVRAKLHIGFLSLMTSGYLGVLTAGGAEVAKFLASKGLGNLGTLKETVSKLRK